MRRRWKGGKEEVVPLRWVVEDEGIDESVDEVNFQTVNSDWVMMMLVK